MQRVGNPERDGFRLPDREGLGYLLPDHDVKRGKDQEAGQERYPVNGGCRQFQQFQQRPYQSRHERLADPAQAERGHRDAELAGRQVGFEVAHDSERAARRAAAGIGFLLDPDEPGLDQRKFRRHEEAVDGEQRNDQQQGKRGAHVAVLPGETRRSAKPACYE